MKLIVREHINSITEVQKKTFNIVIEEIDNYGRIPKNIGLQKGDLLVYRGPGDIVRLQAGTNGQILTADDTTETGLRWVTPS